ncbi:MAG: DUF3298 domain-containing protein [Anaerolineales bacterium]|nr:DUF3298 domain-containing protein [Anaerolineales bacterium]
MTWHRASSYCTSRGAYLVTIQSEAENEFVFGLNPSTWLGATDEVQEGVWVWANGEPWSYTHWYPGEPNNVGDTGEQYLSYWGGYTLGWNDIPNSEMPFICEWDAELPAPDQVLTLTSESFEQESQSPPYRITAQTPRFEGSDDPRVLAFNRQVAEVVQREIALFGESMVLVPDPPITNGSWLDITYSLLSPPGDLVSLKFVFNGYFDGAAHPFRYSLTFTFDLQSGQQVALADLFLPGADYLRILADVCLADLRGREVGDFLFAEGAAPTAENYNRWNVTASGFLITFDTYQVAPGAAGPQEVLVPYAALQAIIDPQGLLAGFAP